MVFMACEGAQARVVRSYWNMNLTATLMHPHPVKAFNHHCQFSQVEEG